MKRSLFRLGVVVILVAALVLAGIPRSVQAAVTTIYTTNFNSGYADWTATSATSGISLVTSPIVSGSAVRITNTGNITRTVSTVGYSGISVTSNLAASLLETADWCYAEYNTGSGWVVMQQKTDGQDNSVYSSVTVSNISGADNNANFQIRYRGQDSTSDHCYAEDITVSGTLGSAPTNTPIPPTATPGPTSTPPPGGSVPGDPLTGSGVVSRTLLTYANLTSGSSTAPVDDSAFALPSTAAMPLHTFEGTLTLNNEATSGGFSEVKDTYRYTGSGDNPRKHLPEFSFQFVQNGSHLIPSVQGLSYTGHLYWNYIVGPGRAWSETTDSGWSRASFPFALVQRNSNCTHNGVLTFLFNNTAVSNVRYQITQETCVYYQVNMWGQLSATYAPGAVANSLTLRNNHATEVSNRMPTKPIAALAIDYPSSGINTSVFGAGTAQTVTSYGVYYNGVNYIGSCTTRYGSYAYCDNMRTPSYSTAKTAFTSVALMRLAQKYGAGVNSLLIKDYVPEYTQGGTWTNTTFGNMIDMASGNYRVAGFESDEGGTYESNFFLAEDYASKMTAAFNFPWKVQPGTVWIYHSHDTFLLARAMNNYLVAQGGGSDIFNMVRDEVYTPINLSAGAKTTLRTDNSASGAPFGGYGLFWTQDDLAKVAKLINNDSGAVNGTQILDSSILANGMQKNSADRGFDTSINYMYNNSFWAYNYTTADNAAYTCSPWVPFMSGYGGITVAMAPNGATYYITSDNEEFTWKNQVTETNKLSPMCP